jgi:uncharacterized protein (DUF2062 family)
MDLMKFEADLVLMRTTNDKLAAETAKLVDETLKLRTERLWMPFVWGATFASAVFGVVIALIKVLH